MPNIASLLKAEITRVARKEIRAEIERLRTTSSQQRSAMVALRRQVEDLARQLRQIDKARARPAAAPSGDQDAPVARRFSAARLAAHRSKLGLSAASYGELAQVSGQTIYNWEQGKSRPGKDQLERLAAVRDMKHPGPATP